MSFKGFCFTLSAFVVSGWSFAGDQELPKLSCVMVYNGTEIQGNPLFEKTFEVDLNKESEPQKYEVSPGDGEYYAVVGLNGRKDGTPNGAFVSVMNIISGVKSMAFYPLSAKELHVVHQLGDSKTLQVYCKSK